MLFRILTFVVSITLLVGQVSATRADIIAQSDFQDGTVDGWNQVFSATAVNVIPNSGPLGNGDFSIEAIPRETNQLMFPQQDSKPGFIGSYLSSNATHVQFDYRAEGSLANGIELYVVMLNGSGNRWVSLGNVVPTTVWQTASISIQELDLIRTLGSNSYATDFANITTLGLRFQESANQTGGSAVGSTTYSLFLDNIQLQSIPEPSSLIIFGVTALACVARRKRNI